MAQTLRLKAQSTGLRERTLARVTFEDVVSDERKDCFFALTVETSADDLTHLDDYAGVLVDVAAEERLPKGISIPIVTGYEHLNLISQDTVAAVNPGKGSTHLLYRPESIHNVIFMTVRCNSNCLMCSQPPALSDDAGIVEEHLRLIELIKDPPEVLGITGGEPTLLKDGLIRILERLNERFPDTHLQMLTNGRMYAYENLVKGIAAVGNRSFVSAVPLYSDVATEHDYIVQAKGAFDETVKGLYHAARHGLKIEIRVVLHKQTLPRLVRLMEYIYRNLPFVSHVALMGLENMGYVKKNWNLLWEDPIDYSQTLEEAVRYLYFRRVPVSIYNLQLCILPRTLWAFARKSISDYKNINIKECQKCDAIHRCGGLFKSSELRHSRGIHPLHWETDPFETEKGEHKSCDTYK